MSTFDGMDDLDMFFGGGGGHIGNCRGNPCKCGRDKAVNQFVALKARLAEADENLLSMVNQYCAKTVRPDGTPETYSHDFMSTGEAAFEYLVEKGLAKWCENGVDIYDLKFQESEAKP